MTRLFCRRFFLLAAFSAALVLLSSAPSPALAKGLSPAANFIQDLGNTALMSLTEKKLDRKTRENRVREILRKNFDIAAIGKFALGTHWRSASESQRSDYMKLFEDMIVQTYTTRFEDYSGQELKVNGSTPSGKDFIVSSQVVQKDGPSINLEWRVRNQDGMKVVDVIVEGVSMSVTQRSDFSAVIQKSGGSLDALLSSMRERGKTAKSDKT